MDKKFYLIVSTIIAFCIYILFIFLIILYIKNEPLEVDKFSSTPEETAIELNFVVENSNEKEQVHEEEVSELKENKEEEESATQSTKSVSDLKSLFSNVSDIGTKKATQEEIKEQSKKYLTSRFKSKIEVEKTTQKIELSKLADLKNITNSSKSSTIPSSKGNFDEYYSMINTYILRKWYNYPLITDVHYLVVANITIDSTGNFSFVMLKFSGDNRVDEAIKLFLKNQTLEKYPVSPDKVTKTIRVNFKPYLD